MVKRVKFPTGRRVPIDPNGWMVAENMTEEMQEYVTAVDYDALAARLAEAERLLGQFALYAPSPEMIKAAREFARLATGSAEPVIPQARPVRADDY